MRLMFYISAFIFLYELLSMIWPLNAPLPLKLLLALVLLAGAFKSAIFQKIGGGMFFAPNLPRPVMLAGSLLYNMIVVALILLLAKDILWLLWKIALRRPFPAAAASLIVLFLAAALSAWGTWEAVRVPDVRKHDVFIAGLAPEFDGKTFAVLVDIHAGSLHRRPVIQAIVDRTMEQKPDFILMPGDFVDGLVSTRAHDLEPLAQLHAPLGVYGTSGNHEYYSGYTSWLRQLGEYNIDMLENAHRVISLEGAQLVIAGVSDQQGARFGFEGPDLDKALDGVPEGAPIILMSHRPELAPASAARGVALQLSGHTHGGMMPGLSMIVARANGGFVKGWYDVDGLKLFNSPGTLLWDGFPLRIFDPSEITVMTLHTKK